MKSLGKKHTLICYIADYLADGTPYETQTGFMAYIREGLAKMSTPQLNNMALVIKLKRDDQGDLGYDWVCPECEAVVLSTSDRCPECGELLQPVDGTEEFVNG